MKTIVRKIVVAFIAIGFISLQACEKHTCPTYSKNEVKQEKTSRV